MKKVLEGIGAILLFLMFLIVISTVILRYIFNISAPWFLEMSQICFILLTFIGVAAGMADESLIKITFLIDCLSEGTQRVLRIIGRLFMISFLIIFVIGAYKNVLFNWDVGFITVNWFKIGYIYLVLLISGIVMILYLFLNMYYDISGRKFSFLSKSLGGKS